MTEGILNKTLAELFSILEKCFLLNLTPTSYPKQSKEIHRRLIKVRLQSFYKSVLPKDKKDIVNILKMI